MPLNILKVASSWNDHAWPMEDLGIDSIFVFSFILLINEGSHREVWGSLKMCTVFYGNLAKKMGGNHSWSNKVAGSATFLDMIKLDLIEKIHYKSLPKHSSLQFIEFKRNEHAFVNLNRHITYHVDNNVFNAILLNLLCLIDRKGPIPTFNNLNTCSLGFRKEKIPASILGPNKLHRISFWQLNLDK